MEGWDEGAPGMLVYLLRSVHIFWRTKEVGRDL